MPGTEAVTQAERHPECSSDRKTDLLPVRTMYDPLASPTDASVAPAGRETWARTGRYHRSGTDSSPWPLSPRTALQFFEEFLLSFRRNQRNRAHIEQDFNPNYLDILNMRKVRPQTRT